MLVKDYGGEIDWNIGAFCGHDEMMFDIDKACKMVCEKNGIRYVFGSISTVLQGGRIPPQKNLPVSEVLSRADKYNELGIDGFNSTSKFQPCTPLGVMKIFDSIGYNLDGKNVLVCGQSDIVGRPLVDMLIKRHCNVISVNSTGSYMKNTAYVTKLANVVISAVGKRNFISHIDLFNTDICIDVGINYDENSKQHGDCADEVYKMNNIKVTPRIGGVGLMTRAMLLYNVCVARYGEEKMEKVIE